VPGLIEWLAQSDGRPQISVFAEELRESVKVDHAVSRSPRPRPDPPVSFQEAEAAAERLAGEIEHARSVLQDCRAALGEGPSDNDQRLDQRWSSS
jgi:hypothetical protein